MNDQRVFVDHKAVATDLLVEVFVARDSFSSEKPLIVYAVWDNQSFLIMLL